MTSYAELLQSFPRHFLQVGISDFEIAIKIGYLTVQCKQVNDGIPNETKIFSSLDLKKKGQLSWSPRLSEFH